MSAEATSSSHGAISSREAAGPDAPTLHLVVAAFREELNWIANVPPALVPHVIFKCPASASERGIALDRALERRGRPAFHREILPNVGREAHSYLHHIVSRIDGEGADGLADWTVFVQGHPFDHCFDLHRRLRALASSGTDALADGAQRAGFEWIGHLIDTDTSDGARLFASWSKNTRVERLDMPGFARAVWGEEGPGEYSFVCGGQFVASRSAIRARPLDFWRNALQVASSFPDAAHCFERSWDRVFGVTGIDRAWLGEERTVWLKPVRERRGDAGGQGDKG